MIKMITVMIDQTTEYAITFSQLKYQLRVNNKVVLEAIDLAPVRARLLEETGV
jgi:hypothetical protein